MTCSGEKDCARCALKKATLPCHKLTSDLLAVRVQHQLDMGVADHYQRESWKLGNRVTIWKNVALGLIAVLIVLSLVLSMAVIRVNSLAEIAKHDFNAMMDCYEKIETCQCPETP